MVKATKQDIGTFSQCGKVLVQFLANLLFGLEHCILDGTLDIPMAKFFWVDFRCIRRQKFNMDFRMRSKIFFHQLALMSARTIPNDDERLSNAATKMLQTLNHLFGIDRTFKMLLVDVACDGQACHRGNLTPIFSDPFQVRRLSTRRPSPTDRFGEGDSKFIFKNHFCAEPPRFFLSCSNLY